MVQTRQSHHPSGRIAPLEGRQLLIDEANALLVRLHQVQPFEWTMPMVAAAFPSLEAQKSIYHLISNGRVQLRQKTERFIAVLNQDQQMPLHKCQSAYSILKLQFNSLLDQFDIFADVVNQRSEHEVGVWIAGLDVFAADALQLEDDFYRAPALVCYLDRGHGAAIRRARTRLPGGKKNPVAVIKIPRERMVGSGIGSSLVHEVGHQGAALLGLIPSLKPLLAHKAAAEPERRIAWKLYELWISEILSDVWSVATLGISATTGLVNVVSLPAYFVFRMPDGDPHPFPWIRVKISLAFGKALYPDPQWNKLEALWEQMYPTAQLRPVQQDLIRELSETLPHFTKLVLQNRPASLEGMALGEVFPTGFRQPAQLRQLYEQWRRNPEAIYKARPGLVFATIGQARADRTISPFEENRLLSQALRQWALMKMFNH
ncbi:MAG: hypothetical protein ACKV1O_10155 [Saprospiraceae bacterium]